MSAAPQEIVEAVLAAATTAQTIAIVDVTSTVNVRWADNSLTTNGFTTSTSLTVVAFAVAAVGPGISGSADAAGSPAAGAALSTGVVTSEISDLDEVDALVAAAEQAARESGPAADSRPLLGPDPAGGLAGRPDWAAPAAVTSVGALAGLTRALGSVLEKAAGDDVGLYGYVEHSVRSTWVGSSTGLRVRTDQPQGHVGITARARRAAVEGAAVEGAPVEGAAGGGTVRSSWVGRAFGDPAVLDPAAMYAELTRRLGWAARRVELPAGRYDTVLPPDAVADLVTYLYFSTGARAAADGHSVYSAPGGEGTRVGQQVTDPRVSVVSDPGGAGFAALACADRLVARSSSGDESVFDTGLPLAATDWISGGVARALITSRASAADTGLPVAPGVENLVVRVEHGVGSTDDLVAGMKRGLLLTSLWYIREVDPRTLLLTGLTRDGVYLVEDGAVVGEVNNFRFNESPLDVLNRFSAAGATVPALSREWGEYFSRTAVPPLRIPDFMMSSVSEAI